MSLFCVSSFFPLPSTWGTFPAPADQAAGILVETGNSVDYSLAIRLLSLQWLSLLHHEIAWLSPRLESVLCSNPPANPHPPTASPPLRPAKPPFPFLSPPQEKVHLAPLRSVRQCSSKTGWLAVQSLLPHFLWPQFYPSFFCSSRNMFYDGYTSLMVPMT